MKSAFGEQPPSSALIHGYHTSFAAGAILLTIALVVALTFINAKKEQLPAEAALATA